MRTLLVGENTRPEADCFHCLWFGVVSEVEPSPTTYGDGVPQHGDGELPTALYIL